MPVNKHPNQWQKEERVFKTAFAVWLLGVILVIAFWVAVIVVAWHFISRLW